jgi:uncharacterized protein YggE
MRIASTAAAMALLAAALTGCAELRATAELPGASLITVTGTGRVAVRPDTALAQLGAEARAASLADATADVAKRMTAVLERVRALGVQERDVTTVTYAVDPLVAPRRSEEEPPRILGYRAANIVQLRIRQLDAVGRILDVAVAAGANTLRGLVFTVSDPAPMEAQARALAVQSAGAKAQQLAAAAGVRLGELVRITEGEPPVRPAAERLAVTALTTGPGPIEPGQQEIVVTVTAHYRIAQ